MARERTADDQVIALLARSSVPLERSQIAATLSWAKSFTASVLHRLILQDMVELTPGIPTGVGGRPSSKFALKLKREVPLGIPLERRFEVDTCVVTPSDREARVILHRRDGYVEIEYLDGPRAHAKACIKADLLKAFQPGRERPTPVSKT